MMNAFFFVCVSSVFISRFSIHLSKECSCVFFFSSLLKTISTYNILCRFDRVESDFRMGHRIFNTNSWLCICSVWVCSHKTVRTRIADTNNHPTRYRYFYQFFISQIVLRIQSALSMWCRDLVWCWPPQTTHFLERLTASFQLFRMQCWANANFSNCTHSLIQNGYDSHRNGFKRKRLICVHKNVRVCALRKTLHNQRGNDTRIGLELDT